MTDHTRYFDDLSPEAQDLFGSILSLFGEGMRDGLAELFGLELDRPLPLDVKPAPRPSLRPHNPNLATRLSTWIDLVDAAIEWCDQVPDSGRDFAESVQDKLESIRDSIENLGNVTPGQETAIINMREGLKKWLGSRS